MEFFDNIYCICGKLVMDNEIYCCDNCRMNDNGNSQPTSTSTNSKTSAQMLPPVNLQFSITITPNIYKASDSNSKYYSCYSSSSSYDSNVSSSFTSMCTLDRDFNENYDYVYTRSRYNNRFNDEEEEDDDDTTYISQLSSSNPIPIPTTKTVNHELEPNKGTFGKESTIF